MTTTLRKERAADKKRIGYLSHAYFSVYAPNHVVYGLGSSDFYGAIISSLFYVGGGASVHYDAALARAPSRKLAVQKATWAQYPGN